MRTLPFLLASVAVAAACAPADVIAEVLPPRTSVTCSAPSVSSSIAARGLLDLAATDVSHGAYVADLRLSVKAADAHVDGIAVSLTLPDGASDDAISAADDFADGAQNGDVFLVAKKEDEVRQAVLENITLLPREVATELLDSPDLDLGDNEFATVGVELQPILVGVDGDRPVAVSTTFALDVCNGCLVTPPEACPATAIRNPVCRVGQDVPLFSPSCPAGAAP